MVFSNLPPAEKEAFFGLLDEFVGPVQAHGVAYH